ncbi:hypothetical protein M9Y10_036685, partial [Tritrichomonas musculus]
MFNLSNLLLDEYEESNNLDYSEPIKLLVEASSKKFKPAVAFLYMILIKKYGEINRCIFEKEVKKYVEETNEISEFIYKLDFLYLFYKYNNDIYEQLYQIFRHYDFLYLFDDIQTFYYLEYLNLETNQE